jgi:hypothetical protein
LDRRRQGHPGHQVPRPVRGRRHHQRAGVITEGEASTIADVLVNRIKAGPPPAPFAGEITCYIELGDDRIGLVNINFLSGPAPHRAIHAALLAGRRSYTPVRGDPPGTMVRSRSALDNGKLDVL